MPQAGHEEPRITEYSRAKGSGDLTNNGFWRNGFHKPRHFGPIFAKDKNLIQNILPKDPNALLFCEPQVAPQADPLLADCRESCRFISRFGFCDDYMGTI
jgi:hypothetical protein